MILLVLFATFISASGFAALIGSTTQVDQIALRAVAKSSNFEVYRNAVETYARANKGYVGTIPDAWLALPSYHLRDSGISNYATATQIFVYTTTPVKQQNLNTISGRSFSISGIKSTTGVTVPGLGLVSYAMPSQIPDGAYTSVATK